MSERSELISKLKEDLETRWAYINAKAAILVPSQVRALRLKSDMPKQTDLAREAGMKQSRISFIETPGSNLTLETLARLAAAFKVGLVVKFVPFSEMLSWENDYSQDKFDVVRLDDDEAFLSPAASISAIDECDSSLIGEPGLSGIDISTFSLPSGSAINGTGNKCVTSQLSHY